MEIIKKSKVSGIVRVKFGPNLTLSENGHYFLECNENNFFLIKMDYL